MARVSPQHWEDPNWAYSCLVYRNSRLNSVNGESFYKVHTPQSLHSKKWERTTGPWVITSTAIIGKASEFTEKILKIKHYKEDNNRLSACAGCNLKDPTIKQKSCYFKYSKNRTFTIKVSSKRILYADLPDIKNAIKYRANPREGASKTNEYKITTNEERSRPLNIFTMLPQELWKEIAKANNKKAVFFFLITTSRSIHNQYLLLAVCSFTVGLPR